MKLFLYAVLVIFSPSATYGFVSAKPPAASTIIETPHFRDLRLYADSDTLILLDIDDTLIIPAQTVEQDTKEVVSDLQRQTYRIMGLTTQGLALATRTVQQLLDNGIDLIKTAPSQDEIYLMNGRGVLYRHGILFTAGTPKGPALEKLLKTMNDYPKKIVFINDKESHLLDVAESAKKLDIDFIGLRYSYGDERVSHFSPELTDVQFHFSTISHLLSDEEAQDLLEQLHESS